MASKKQLTLLELFIIVCCILASINILLFVRTRYCCPNSSHKWPNNWSDTFTLEIIYQFHSYSCSLSVCIIVPDSTQSLIILTGNMLPFPCSCPLPEYEASPQPQWRVAKGWSWQRDDEGKQKERVDRGGMHKHRMRKAAWIIDKEHQASRKTE